MTRLGKYFVGIISLLYNFEGVADRLIEFQPNNVTGQWPKYTTVDGEINSHNAEDKPILHIKTQTNAFRGREEPFFYSQQIMEGKIESDKHSSRKTRSKSNENTSLDQQFAQLCSRFGSQPCTCYYPNNPNVPKLELSNDKVTEIASGANGSGPQSCQDLKKSGYNLDGFYMVRFNSRRAKTVFCELNEKVKKGENRPTIQLISEKDVNGGKNPQSIRFFGGVRGKKCTFLYSDHPDARPSGIYQKPTSCEDLHLIGHNLKGFYAVQSNPLKVQIIYCDFSSKTITKSVTDMTTKSTSNCNESESKLFCNGLGSQPCSCYYSNSKDILQIELGNDKITKQALNENGTGPASCKGLNLLVTL